MDKKELEMQMARVQADIEQAELCGQYRNFIELSALYARLASAYQAARIADALEANIKCRM